VRHGVRRCEPYTRSIRRHGIAAVHLTVERLFDGPSLGGQVPVQVAFAPDGRSVSYLANADDDRSRLDLYRYDIATGETVRLVDARRLEPAQAPMTDEEKAQQERRRLFVGGISHYAWRGDGGSILLVAGGNVYVLEIDTNEIRRLNPFGTRQTDVRFSSTGRYVGYVRTGDLYLYDLLVDRERRISDDASDTVTNGLAEFIAQEEMHRYDGYWFSDDDRYIAFTRVDHAPVALTHRYEIDAEDFRIFPQRYPFAGAANASVQLAIIEIETGAQRWVPYQESEDDYLARVVFAPGRICTQVQSRDQRRLVLRAFDIEWLLPTELLRETSETWINLHDNLRFLPASSDFLWTSQRDDHVHLYLYRTGQDPIPLTTGTGRVNHIHHVAPDHVCFSGWFDRPVEQHGYRVDFTLPGKLQRLTHAPGWHELHFAPDGKHFVDRSSTLSRPPNLAICSIERDGATAFGGNVLDETHPYWPFHDAHCPAELGKLAPGDDEAAEPLWYRLTRPPDFDPTRRYPVIIHVYGGPGVQRVRDEWAPLTLQLLAQRGYVVFELDNRGSGNRSKSFEDPIYRRLGRVEVEDQLCGVAYLKQQSWVDSDRIGILGHSYGGYMSLMCLCLAPNVFRAGVAVAPVTDWTLYDTHYTERYLGTPADNLEGYADSAVMAHVQHMRGALLVMHGMADDNVLFTHSTKLFKALQDRHFRFEMMTYPGAKHSLQQTDVAIHRFLTILEFFERQLTAAGRDARTADRR
jgi:dipeptidyl-peptidase 4